MIATRVRLSYFDKILLTESAAHQVSKCANYRFFEETGKLVNISKANFTYALVDLSNVKVAFFKKGFDLNFVKK